MKSVFADVKVAAKLVAMYVDANRDNSKLEQFAKEFGTSVASVRGKLVSLGEYNKLAPKPTKAKASGNTQKAEIVKGVEIILSLREGSLASLSSATKKDLETLSQTLIKLGDKA